MATSHHVKLVVSFAINIGMQQLNLERPNMKKYKVCYYVGSGSSVKTKYFDDFSSATQFAISLPVGDVLEIKRIEE